MNMHSQRRRLLIHFTCIALGVLTSLTMRGAAVAQEGFSWEYTPYKIQVWIADGGEMAGMPGRREQLVTELAQLFEITGFSEWSTDVKWMPPEVQWAAGEPAANLTAARMRQATKDVLTNDKLFLVQLIGGAFHQVEVSEFDLALRSWSELETASIENEALTAETIFELVRRAFRPIMQLENPNEKLIWGRPRAIRLASGSDSPVRVPVGAILWPATRYNDRAGEPLAKDGIVPTEFTRLKAKEVKDNRVLCDIYSGLRNPFRKRMGVRSERYALVIKPRYASTTIEVVKRSEEAEPLIDYEIFEKPFDAQQDPKLLGRTDFLGQLVIPVDPASTLKLLYVKCGNQLLARLPVVPGEVPVIRAPIGDDELRLQAEGFILGMQSATMDAYARRLELAARFKRRLEAGQFDKAEAMIPESRVLPNRAQLMQALDQREPTFITTNPRVQSRIDLLFGEGRKLLNAFPDSDLTGQMTADLAKAKAAPPPAKAPDTSAPDATATPATNPPPTTPPDNPSKG